MSHAKEDDERKDARHSDDTKEHPAKEAASKGTDVGPVKHGLALIVVLLLCCHTALHQDKIKTTMSKSHKEEKK